MKARNISVTLDKAKEWYNSGNATLKEIALQAFTEIELKYGYESITNLEDVYNEVALIRDSAKDCIEPLSCGKHLLAIYDVNNICKALNGDWKPSLVSGSVYYPWVKFYKEKDVPSNRKKDITNYFMYNGEKYALVGGGCDDYGFGLGYCYGGDGYCSAYAGLFGCKSKEIALHMSRFFAKEIFLACYAEKLDKKVTWL